MRRVFPTSSDPPFSCVSFNPNILKIVLLAKSCERGIWVNAGDLCAHVYPQPANILFSFIKSINSIFLGVERWLWVKS